MVNIKSISSPILNDDVSSFKNFNNLEDSYITDNCFSKPNNVISFIYNNNNYEKFAFEYNKNYYALFNNNLDNYLYSILSEYNEEEKYSFINIVKYGVQENDKSNQLFYLNDSLLDIHYLNDNPNSKLKDIKYSFTEEELDNSENIKYDIPLIEDLFTKEISMDMEKSDVDGYIYLYLTINPNYVIDNKRQFDINDFIFELRINNVVTKFFEINFKNKDTDSKSIYNIEIKIAAKEFRNQTGLDELNYFLITIKNKYIYDIGSFVFENFENLMKPFISYDKMTQTNDDIIINCRYDLSIETTGPTNNSVVNVNNPELIQNIEGKRVPVLDNSIIFEMVNRTINIVSKHYTIITIKMIPSSKDIYVFSSKNINFTKKDYKCFSNYCNYIEDTSSFILKSGVSISFMVQSITDIDYKKKNMFSINFLKLNDHGKKKYSEGNLKNIEITDIECVVTANLNVVINPEQHYDFSEDEKEILDNILTFQTNTITTHFGDSSLINISSNNNIVLTKDSELNSEALKEFILTDRDLTHINNNFNSFDIQCFGIYIDHMILDNSDAGSIYLEKLTDISDDNTDIEKQIIVCNTMDKDKDDECYDGFNENTFTVKLPNGDKKRVLIVPETVYKLFNFSNNDQGIFSISNTETDIFNLSTKEFIEKYGDVNDNSFALYPYANLIFLANEYNDEEFVKSNLYIDYYPVIHRITKDDITGNIVWTIYLGEKVLNLKTEKIMKLIVNNDETNVEQSESEIDETLGNIYDTNSSISYPSFVNFKILMETDNGKPSKLNEAVYTGRIINESDNPVVIEDISVANFLKDSKLFKISDNVLLSNSFMKYEISSGNNYIATDSLKISKYTDHSDVTVLNGKLFILKPGGSINVKIYNNTDITTIPDSFGRTLNRLKDSLHFNLYYIKDNEDSDNTEYKYTFRENGITESTNLETVVTVSPLINSVNFDSSYFKYTGTIYNIISDDIVNRSVLFKILKNKRDYENSINQKYYEKFIDNAIKYEKNELDSTNEDDEEIINQLNDTIYQLINKISILDLENLYFLESGKDFSYIKLLSEMIKNIASRPAITDEEQKRKKEDIKSILNNYGLQVIARTEYKNGAVEYNMTTITNYIDLINNPKYFLPKLNRLTGSLYHLLTINNKHENLYEYKIIVDNKEYNEGDLVYNTFANEEALHKFRLYYRPKLDYSELININEDLGVVSNPTIGSSVTITKDGEEFIRFKGNLAMFIENGEIKYYNDDVITISNIDNDFYNNGTYKKTFLSMNYQSVIHSVDVGYNGDIIITDENNETKDINKNNKEYLISNVGYTDVQCLYEFVYQYEKLTDEEKINIRKTEEYQNAIKLCYFGEEDVEDKILTYDDVNKLKNYILKHGYLIGSLNYTNNLSIKEVDDFSLKYVQNIMRFGEEDIIYKKGEIPQIDITSPFDLERTFRIWDTDCDGQIILEKEIENINNYCKNIEIPKDFKNSDNLVGMYLLDVPNESNKNKTQRWLLADSFEGVIDGTKPFVPNLIDTKSKIIEGKNKKVLHKYTTLTRDEIKDIITNPEENILNEVNFYEGKVSILNDISYDMKYEIVGTAGISKILLPDSNINDLTISASTLVEGQFKIVNLTVEPLNVEINQKIINDENEKGEYLFDITSDALPKNITEVEYFQPIFRIEPNETLTIKIKFNKLLDTEYETSLDIRVQNNVKKKYYDDNIKWDNYVIKLKYIQTYSFNTDIIKNLLPYKIYEYDDNNQPINAEYYDIGGLNDEFDKIDPNKIFNALDIYNFNKNYLYYTLLYLDDTLIYNSSLPNKKIDKNDSNYKLLISKKILDRKLYIGDHTLTLITVKYNGLINYQNYYITIIDHNVYKRNGEKYNYYLNNPEKYEELFNDGKLKKTAIIPRQPKNKNYEGEEYLNELFLDSQGNLSMVTKDLSTNTNYLYRFTEIMNFYMNFSSYITENDYYLYEKNYQQVIRYYNLIKEQYSSFTKDIDNKINTITGNISNLIKNISYHFENFDTTLTNIKDYYQKKEEDSKYDNAVDKSNEFLNRLFYEDNILSKYKEFNALFTPDNMNFDSGYTSSSLDSSPYSIKIMTPKYSDFKYNSTNKEDDNYQANNLNYILTNNNIDNRISVSYLHYTTFNPINSKTNEYIYQVLGNSIYNSNIITINTDFIYFNIENAIRFINQDKEFSDEDKLHKSYKFFLSLSINKNEYLYIFNLYNIYESIEINDTSSILLSEDENITKTLINKTNMEIKLGCYIDDNLLIADKEYSINDLRTINEDEDTIINYKSRFKISYQTNLGYNDKDEKNMIVLPPYATCNINVHAYKSVNENFSYFFPKQIKRVSNNDDDLNSGFTTTNLTNNLNIDNINTTLKIMITSIGDKTDKIYKYIHQYELINSPYYKIKFMYFPFKVVYMSQLLNNLNNEIYSNYIKFNDLRVINNKYPTVILFNDTKNIIAGNFNSNGYHNIEKQINNSIYEFYNYMPLRYNTFNATNNYDDKTDYNVLSYNDTYLLNVCNAIDVETINKNIELNDSFIFPMILKPLTVNNEMNYKDYYNISFTINILKSFSLDKKTFENIKFAKKLTNIVSTNITYSKFSSLLDITNNSTIYEGANLDLSILTLDDYKNSTYNYGSDMNNGLEYIVANLNDFIFENENTSPIYLYFSNYIREETNIETKINGKEEEKIFEIKEEEFFNKSNENLNKIFNIIKKSDESTDEQWNEIIETVDKISYDNELDITDDRLKNLLLKLYSVKSNIAIIQQNIQNQNTILEKKASVKDFKEWINENIFSLANFEYSISELLSNIYYLSNKGIDIKVGFEYSITKNQGTEEEEIITGNNGDNLLEYDFKNSLPLANPYLDLTNACFIRGIKIVEKAITVDELGCSPNVWKSALNTESDSVLGNSFIRKVWIGKSDDNNVDAIFYKKNFIDTSNLLTFNDNLKKYY